MSEHDPADRSRVPGEPLARLSRRRETPAESSERAAGYPTGVERLLEISAAQASDVDAVWSFRIGERRSDVLVRDGVASLAGDGLGADVTVSCTAETWDGLLAGELSPQIAWALGRLQVSGDMRLAQRTRAIFAF